MKLVAVHCIEQVNHQLSEQDSIFKMSLLCFFQSFIVCLVNYLEVGHLKSVVKMHHGSLPSDHLASASGDLGPGTPAAAGRRGQAEELERRWRRGEASNTLAHRQGWSA